MIKYLKVISGTISVKNSYLQFNTNSVCVLRKVKPYIVVTLNKNS